MTRSEKNKTMTRWGIGPAFALSSLAFAAAVIFLNLTFFPDCTFYLFTRMTSILTGTVLIAAGMCFYLIPARQVMNYFEEDRLCTSGIYAYVRHPIYACWITAIVPGTVIISGLSLAATVPFFMYLAFKVLIKKEEKYLENRFGGKYREYRDTVGEILPRFR